MHASFSTLIPVAALVAVVAAIPGTLEARDICSTGTLHCCETTQTSTTATLASASGLLGGIVLPNIGGLVGLNCNPITAVGVGSGASCAQQTVCCDNTSFNGVVNLGCSPVNVQV